MSKIGKLPWTHRTLEVCLGLLGSLGLSAYLEGTHFTGEGSSFLILVVWIVSAYLWKAVIKVRNRRLTVVLGIYSLLLALCLMEGKFLERGWEMTLGRLAIYTLLLGIFLYGLIAYGLIKLGGRKVPEARRSRQALRIAFLAVVVLWFLGYLAAFPGVYVGDAMTWYREFSDPSMPVSSQWSPVYAGLFYLFVHQGYLWFANYWAGFAVFTFVQMSLVLYAVYRVLRFVHEEAGDLACGLAAAFYGLLPMHMIISVSSVQAAPFMACLSLVLVHLARMVMHAEDYWADKGNILRFAILCIVACVLRNNALYAFVLTIPFCLAYRRDYRLKLVGAFCIAAVAALVYSGPLLSLFGVTKGTALREMLSIPLQQMAYVYNFRSDELNADQVKALESYVPQWELERYPDNTGISDPVKENLDVDLVERDPGKFLNLYVSLGSLSPSSYFRAFYLQDFGLLYLDKAYPDSHIWHPYLNYASYTFDEGDYITIPRLTAFAPYNDQLGKLFGSSENGNGFTSLVTFSSTPILGPLCRASTYFWALLLVTACGICGRWRDEWVVLAPLLGLTLTILLAPLITYRYYAPVVFCFPIMLLVVARRFFPQSRLDSGKAKMGLTQT